VDTHGGSSDSRPSSRELAERHLGTEAPGFQEMKCQILNPFVGHVCQQIEKSEVGLATIAIEFCNLVGGTVGSGRLAAEPVVLCMPQLVEGIAAGVVAMLAVGSVDMALEEVVADIVVEEQAAGTGTVARVLLQEAQMLLIGA